MTTAPKLAPSAASRKASALEALLARSPAAVMGVLNVTPDSFSDSGRYIDPERAVDHARQMVAEGAGIIDIGAESTRPYGGMQPVSAEDEIARLRPVLSRVIALGAPVSVDTMKAEVARFALAAGAAVINDVWGLQRDPAMADIVAAHDVAVVIMHNRAAADAAIDIMSDIADYFARSLAIADSAGIAKGRIVLDPGIGFGKTPEQSMTALARLADLKAFGCPLLVGASRKRFIASVMPSEPGERLGGSLAAHLTAVRNGARIIRAHDVAATVQALAVMNAIEQRQ